MVTVEIVGGPTYQIEWNQGMNVQNALESAYNDLSNDGDFIFSLQYYGANLGYLVNMINETYDTFVSKSEPYFFWEFLVNNSLSDKGIDSAPISDEDIITFQFVPYYSDNHENTMLQAKLKLKKFIMSVN